MSNFIVVAKDQFGNLVKTSGAAITISDGTLSRGPYLTSALGQAIVSNWIETAAGTQTLTATAKGLTGAASNSFTIAPGAGILSFAGQPSASAAAGSDIGPVTVRVADKYGNGESGVAVTLGLSSGSLTGGAQTLTTDATGDAVFSPVTEDRAGNYVLQATATGLAGIRSASFTISAASAATLSFLTQPKNAAAGNNLGTVTAQLYDQYGNAITTAGVSVTMSVSSGTLNGTTTATTNAQGKAIFTTLSATVAGTLSLQGSSGTLTATSQNFAVSPGAVRQLAFIVQPNGTTPGSNLGMVTVQVLDAFGNPIIGQAVSITAAPAILSGTTSTATDDSGDAIFDNLSTNQTGTFTLSAYTAGKIATSSPFTT